MRDMDKMADRSQPATCLVGLLGFSYKRLTIMLTPTIKKHTYQGTCVCLLPVCCRLFFAFSLLFTRSVSPSTNKVQTDFSDLKMHYGSNGRMNREYMNKSTKPKAFVTLLLARQSAALLTHPGTSCHASRTQTSIYKLVCGFPIDS